MALTQVQGGMLAGSSNTVTTIQSNGTTAITIDASQNVGIGTSSPANRLDVSGAATATPVTNGIIRILTTGSNPPTGNGGGLLFTQVNSGGTNQNYASITGSRVDSSANNKVDLCFATGDPTGGVAVAERMRITSSGDLLVGTTSAIFSGKQTISFAGNINNGITLSDSANVSGTSYLVFVVGGSVIGTVARVGATSAVVYNTTSDQRLKSNIADANPVLDKLMDVKVRQFDWTDGDLHQDAGFIAQELAPVLSGIVTEGKTTEDMWQVDYSRLTPYLVKAIQELNAKVDAQAAEIAALKAAK